MMMMMMNDLLCICFVGFTVDDGLTLHDVGLYIANKGLTIKQDGMILTGGLTIYDRGSIQIYLQTYICTYIHACDMQQS